MKKLLLSLLAICFLSSCSKDTPEVKQTYTSFMFHQTVDVTLPNCVAAYKNADGKYIKIGDLGNLSKDKYSNEIKVLNESVDEIYFFTDYNSVILFDEVYKLVKNTKMVFDLVESVRGIPVKDKSDSYQYPQ